MARGIGEGFVNQGVITKLTNTDLVKEILDLTARAARLSAGGEFPREYGCCKQFALTCPNF